MVPGAVFFKGTETGSSFGMFVCLLGWTGVEFGGNVKRHNWGAIWSYRALDLAMDLQVGRSLTWAGSSGLFSPRERKQVAVSAYFCWFLSGGTKIEKINMS